jgi:hypothetical protein
VAWLVRALTSECFVARCWSPLSVGCSVKRMNDGRQISCNDRSAHLLLLRFEPHLKCFECTKQSKTEIPFSSPTTSLIASSSRFLEQQLSPLLRCKHHPASWLVSEKPLKRRSFALSCTVAQTHEEEESAFGLNGATCVTSFLCRSEEDHGGSNHDSELKTHQTPRA